MIDLKENSQTLIKSIYVILSKFLFFLSFFLIEEFVSVMNFLEGFSVKLATRFVQQKKETL